MVARALAAGLAALTVGSALWAQTAAGKPPRAWPSWMVDWSPIRAAGDPSAGWAVGDAHASPLEPGAPRVGLLWTAANPAALVTDLDSAAAWIAFGAGGLDGTYRRPLEPATVLRERFDVLGWRRFGAHAGAIGRVTFANQAATPAPLTDVRAPYAMDPFVLADTSAPDRNRVAAQLEGGIGWAWGAWGAGFLAGLVTDKTRTTLAAAPRVTRGTVPALTVGVSRALPVLHARLAVHGRWIGGNETTLLRARTGGTTAFQLGGYYQPDSLVLAPPSGYAFRRADGDGLAGGLALTARTGGTRWAAFAERLHHAARHRSAVGIVDPPTDRWEASATVLGLTGQASLGGAWIVTGVARYVTAGGEATRADLPGVAYRATETALLLSGDVRLRTGAWTAGLWADLRRGHDRRRDFVVSARSDVVDWQAGTGVVLARDLGRLSLGVTAGLRLTTPVAQIPDPATAEPVYQRFIAPALSYGVTPAIAPTAAVATRVWLTDRTSLFLRAIADRISARGAPPLIPAVPLGTRTGWDVALGLALVPRTGPAR